MVKYCWKIDHNFSWDQKKVAHRESRLILRNTKETMRSLKYPNHNNKYNIC